MTEYFSWFRKHELKCRTKTDQCSAPDHQWLQNQRSGFWSRAYMANQMKLTPWSFAQSQPDMFTYNLPVYPEMTDLILNQTEHRQTAPMDGNYYRFRGYRDSMSVFTETDQIRYTAWIWHRAKQVPEENTPHSLRMFRFSGPLNFTYWSRVAAGVHNALHLIMADFFVIEKFTGTSR